MTKCNRCTDPFELWDWKEIGGKWTLCNPYSGNPHVCKNNVKAEISADTKPVKHRSGKEWSPHVGDYKYGDLATPARDTIYTCDKCGSELEVKSFELEGITNIDEMNYLKNEVIQKYHCQCMLLNKIVCPQFCKKCDVHPQVIQVKSRT